MPWANSTTHERRQRRAELMQEAESLQTNSPPLLPVIEGRDGDRRRDEHPEHRALIKRKEGDERHHHADDGRDLPLSTPPIHRSGTVSLPGEGAASETANKRDRAVGAPDPSCPRGNVDRTG
jgi:hypothetical protein